MRVLGPSLWGQLLVAVWLALNVASSTTAALPAAEATRGPCSIEASDLAWLRQALARWQRAEANDLGLLPARLPIVHAFDDRCAFTIRDANLDAATGSSHDGKNVVIGARTVPIGPISFADGSGSFVMSLPSVWRAKGVNGTFGLERLMDAVLLHEIMHTRQAALASASLDEIERIKPTGVELSDDLIQQRFEHNAAYLADYTRERDLLFAAAAASDNATARRLALRALRQIEQRRARWFAGRDAYLGRVEDVFLTMEGMGQWLGYKMFVDLGVTRDAALREVRRGGKYWSQDQGLALILVADRLLPDWKRRAFDPGRWGAMDLLRASIAAQPQQRALYRTTKRRA